MIVALTQSSIILLLTLAAARIFRHQSAAVRLVILTAGLLGALTVPVVAPVIPPFHVSGSLRVARPAERATKQQPWDQPDGVRASEPSASDFFAPSVSTWVEVANRLWIAGMTIGAM